MKMKTYEIPNNIKYAVYFLIDENKIVYVGKTHYGLRRIFQHNDKVFNKYCFIETQPDELDYYEDLYIMKYQPEYNKSYSFIRISLNSAYRQLGYTIRKCMNYNEFVKKIKLENIEIKKFKKTPTILKNDFIYIKNKLEKDK